MVDRVFIVRDIGDIVDRFGGIRPILYATDASNDLYGRDVIAPEIIPKPLLMWLPYIDTDDTILCDVDDWGEESRTILLRGVVHCKNDQSRYPACRICGTGITLRSGRWYCDSLLCRGRTESRILHMADCVGLRDLKNGHVVATLYREGIVTSLKDLFAEGLWTSLRDWSDSRFICGTLRNDIRRTVTSLKRLETSADWAILAAFIYGLSIPGLLPNDISSMVWYVGKESRFTGTHPLKLIASCFSVDDLFAAAVQRNISKDYPTQYVFQAMNMFAKEVESIVDYILYA